MEVDVSILRAASEKLFDHLMEMNIEKLEIPYDYYWYIPTEQEYDVSAEPRPKSFTIGQLSDDWQELRKVATDNRETLSYYFVWLSSILRAVGETLVS